MFFDEEDDIFGGTPKKKFFDIVYNANRNLVEFELEKFIERYVAMEKILEKNIASDAIEKEVEAFIAQDPQSIADRKNDIFIGFVGDVLSNNE